jgi:hypothetical protein
VPPVPPPVVLGATTVKLAATPSCQSPCAGFWTSAYVPNTWPVPYWVKVTVPVSVIVPLTTEPGLVPVAALTVPGPRIAICR